MWRPPSARPDEGSEAGAFSGGESRLACLSRQSPVQVRVAGVDEYVLPGDVAGSLRKQKQNHVRDFLRPSHAFPERNL